MKKNNTPKRQGISLRNMVIAVFMVLTASTIFIAGYSIYSNWISASKESTIRLEADLDDEVYNDVETFVRETSHFESICRTLIENKVIDLETETSLGRVFAAILQDYSNNISDIYYADENGDIYGAVRNDEGGIDTVIKNSGTEGMLQYFRNDTLIRSSDTDLRTSDWYIIGTDTASETFTSISMDPVSDMPIFYATCPVNEGNGKVQGVIATKILLSDLDSSIDDILENSNGIAFIVEKDAGKIIANTLDMPVFVKNTAGEWQRNTIQNTDNEYILDAYEKYLTTGEKDFDLGVLSKGYSFNFTDYTHEGISWLVITAVPNNLFINKIQNNMSIAVLFTVLAGALSILMYYIMTEMLIKPIYDLSDTAKKFTNGDFSARSHVTHNNEIKLVSDAFNKMADTVSMLVNNLESAVDERTERLEKTNDELKENREKLQLILDSTAEAVCGINTSGYCTFCNLSCIRLLGCESADQLLNKDMHPLMFPVLNETNGLHAEYGISDTLRDGMILHKESDIFIQVDGSSFCVEYHSYPQFKNGLVTGAVVTFSDITQRKIDNEKIKYLSYHDVLSGLPNRRFYEETLKIMDTEDNLPLTVVFADINNLKMTNDIFGHTAGDELIIKAGQIIKSFFPDDVHVSRIGGDEFVVLLPHTDSWGIKPIMDHIKKAFADARTTSIICSISIGCDTRTDMKQSMEQTVNNAENAMYREKVINRKSVNENIIDNIIKTLHERSPREQRHSESVSELCRRIGEALDLTAPEIKKLERAGYLHDIGKIVMNESMLSKSKYTPEERESFHQHSVTGYKILNLFDDTLDLAESVYTHHEKWNGTGYPKGLKGKEIPKIARVIAVAEAYDAMINRPYYGSLTKKEALAEISKQSGITLDPDIAEIFITIMSDSV
ncbi:MAG: HD domain-containing phosphohydrolase [Clostridia bacterium]